MQNLIDLCKSLGLVSISLEVNELNVAAINLYEKFDFKRVGYRKNYYKGNNAILMTRELH